MGWDVVPVQERTNEAVGGDGVARSCEAHAFGELSEDRVVGAGFADRALKGLFATSILRSSFANRFERHRFLFAAWRRGRRARALLGQPYEVLLGQPLEEVRSALGVRPFAEVHPRGLPHIELPAPAEGAA